MLLAPLALIAATALFAAPVSMTGGATPVAPSPATTGSAGMEGFAVSATCSDGGRIRMRVSPAEASGHVRVAVEVSGMADEGARWEGGFFSAGSEDPMGGDSADFTRRVVDGGWRAVGTLAAGPRDSLHSIWVRRGAHICSVGTNSRTPLYGMTFCNANDFGLDYLIRRTDTSGRYRVRLLGGTDWGAGTPWSLSIGRVGASGATLHTTQRRANRDGHFSFGTELRLRGDTTVVVKASGPDGNTCRLALRRSW